MYFKAIRKTEHYKENHECSFPWSEVVEIIMAAKNPRKKEGKIEIETENRYILCEMKDNILWVINAKHIK
jgi:beta-galactosidase beta subunit